MRKPTTIPILFTLLLLLLANVGHAAIVVYTDETAFTTDSQSVGNLSFTDNLDSGSKVGDVIDRINVTITGSSGVLAAFPNGNSVNTIDGSGYIRAFIDTSGDTLTFEFDDPVISFGFQVNPRSFGVDDVLSVSADGASSTLTMPSTDISEFRGYVSDTAFSTFSLSYTVNAGDIYGIDNLVAYTAVPEPKVYGMLSAIGLLIFTLYRRSHLARHRI